MGFERLAEKGRAALLSRTHDVEAPPEDDGPRWGVSVVLRPNEAMLERLDAWTEEILSLAGRSHWATGSSAGAHITVRSLEPRRSVDTGDPAVERYAEALRHAASRCGPVGYQPYRFLVTPNSVMLGVVPSDDAADELSGALAVSLGADGWYEADRSRDLWYVNLVHFTTRIQRPTAVLEWVDAPHHLHSVPVFATAAELVRWDFDGRCMVPVRLASARLDRVEQRAKWAVPRRRRIEGRPCNDQC